MNKTTERVMDILGQVVGLPADAGPKTTLEDLGVDQIDMDELIYELEEEFEFKARDIDVAKFVKVADIISYVSVHSQVC